MMLLGLALACVPAFPVRSNECNHQEEFWSWQQFAVPFPDQPISLAALGLH
jgi:hypothetical protein